MSSNILLKFLNAMLKILIACRTKKSKPKTKTKSHRGIKINRMASESSKAIPEARKPEYDSYRMLSKNYVQTRATYLTKLAIKYGRRIKAFSYLLK